MHYRFAFVPRFNLTSIVFQSNFNLLFEDFVLEFWLVFHPFQYQLGYDDNKFLDKPYLPVMFLV
jgi:hypothetical protein